MDDTTETPEPFSGIAEADPTYWATPAMREPVIRALTADGFPVKPPASWFENPKLKQVTALQVTPEGQVFGHIAAWHQSHIGLAGSVKPPKSKSGYAFFATGALQTADGSMVDVGQISLVGGHAPIDVDVPRAVAHYDDTRSAVCDVAIGEDRHGIWVAGALRPEVNDQQVRQLRASAVSGDWRPINGNLELVAVCSVNVPGFPIPRARVASGATLALVAAGIEPIVEARLLEAGGIAQDSEITVVIDALSDRLSMVERSLTASIKDATKQEKLEELRERVRQTRAMTASVDDLRGRVHGRTAGACKPRKKKPMVADAESDDPAAALRARIHGNVTAALVPGMSGKFDPRKHPRGKDGKFIEVGGFVKWMVGSKEHRGKVTAINKDGSISIDENGKTAKVKPNRISDAADTKASIKGKGKPTTSKAPAKSTDYEPVPVGPVPFTAENFPPGTPVRWYDNGVPDFGVVREFRPANGSYPDQLKVDLPVGDHAWVSEDQDVRIIDPSDKRGMAATQSGFDYQIERFGPQVKRREEHEASLQEFDPNRPKTDEEVERGRKSAAKSVATQKKSLAGVDSNPDIADKAGAKKRLSSNIDRLENGPDKPPADDGAKLNNPSKMRADMAKGDGFSKQSEIDAIWAKEQGDYFGKNLDPADQDKLIQLLEEKQKEVGLHGMSDETDLKNLKKWQAERQSGSGDGGTWDDAKDAELKELFAKDYGVRAMDLDPADRARAIELLQEKKASGGRWTYGDQGGLENLISPLDTSMDPEALANREKWRKANGLPDTPPDPASLDKLIKVLEEQKEVPVENLSDLKMLKERQSGGSPAPTEPGPGDGMASQPSIIDATKPDAADKIRAMLESHGDENGYLLHDENSDTYEFVPEADIIDAGSQYAENDEDMPQSADDALALLEANGIPTAGPAPASSPDFMSIADEINGDRPGAGGASTMPDNTASDVKLSMQEHGFPDNVDLDMSDEGVDQILQDVRDGNTTPEAAISELTNAVVDPGDETYDQAVDALRSMVEVAAPPPKTDWAPGDQASYTVNDGGLITHDTVSIVKGPITTKDGSLVYQVKFPDGTKRRVPASELVSMTDGMTSAAALRTRVHKTAVTAAGLRGRVHRAR